MITLKRILGYFGAFITLLAAGLAYFFKAKSDRANSKIGQLEADKALGDVLTKKKEAEDEAIAKQNEYTRLRDAYNAAHTDDQS